MQITFLKGYPDYIGKRFAWAGFGNGPLAYLAAGDPLLFPRYDNYIDLVFASLSVSGNYSVESAPLTIGARASWVLYWFYAGNQGVLTVTIATAGTGQTAGTYVVPATGGGGTGATAVVVVGSAGTITSATLATAGKGYTTAPTFTVAAGGTPGTLTATVGPAYGEVPTGTNLSGELLQLGGFGGTY